MPPQGTNVKQLTAFPMFSATPRHGIFVQSPIAAHPPIQATDPSFHHRKRGPIIVRCVKSKNTVFGT